MFFNQFQNAEFFRNFFQLVEFIPHNSCIAFLNCFSYNLRVHKLNILKFGPFFMQNLFNLQRKALAGPKFIQFAKPTIPDCVHVARIWEIFFEKKNTNRTKKGEAKTGV